MRFAILLPMEGCAVSGNLRQCSNDNEQFAAVLTNSPTANIVVIVFIGSNYQTFVWQILSLQRCQQRSNHAFRFQFTVFVHMECYLMLIVNAELLTIICFSSYHNRLQDKIANICTFLIRVMRLFFLCFSNSLSYVYRINL